MSSVALRRLQTELKSFPRTTDSSVYWLVEDDDVFDLTRWKVIVVGAEDTVYEGEEFHLQVDSILGHPNYSYILVHLWKFVPYCES